MKTHVTEMATNLEAKLLVKNLQAAYAPPRPQTPLPSVTPPPSASTTTASPSFGPAPPRALSGAPGKLITGAADTARWQLLHWSAEEASKRQKQQQDGVISSRPVPRGGLWSTSKKTWTDAGREIINGVRQGIVSSGQVSTIKAHWPQLETVDQDDWSVSEQLLRGWLHTAVSGRWEARHDGNYVAESGGVKQEGKGEKDGKAGVGNKENASKGKGKGKGYTAISASEGS